MALTDQDEIDINEHIEEALSRLYLEAEVGEGSLITVRLKLGRGQERHEQERHELISETSFPVVSPPKEDDSESLEEVSFWVEFTGFSTAHTLDKNQLSEFKLGQRYKAFELPEPSPTYPRKGMVWGIRIETPEGNRYRLWDGEYTIVPDSGTLPARLRTSNTT